jgi:hypothetical protein
MLTATFANIAGGKNSRGPNAIALYSGSALSRFEIPRDVYHNNSLVAF